MRAAAVAAACAALGTFLGYLAVLVLLTALAAAEVPAPGDPHGLEIAEFRRQMRAEGL